MEYPLTEAAIKNDVECWLVLILVLMEYPLTRDGTVFEHNTLS